ncbi:MAG: phosphatidate cytidylyltransferase [Alphaproteobacteria bacterium]
MSVEKEDLEEIKVNNLYLRVFSSFFLILLIYCLFLNDNFFFPIIIHSLVSLSIWEFLRLLNYRNSDRISSDKGNFFLSRQRLNYSDFLVIILINLFISSMILSAFAISFFLVFCFLFIFFFLKFKLSKIIGIFYVSSPYCVLILLSRDLNYQDFLILILFYAVVTDTSSFLVGSFLKGRKIAPKISPGKTISGSVGGLIIPSLISLLIFIETYDSVIMIVVTSIIFSIIVQVGDLIESYYKRVCFVKESSNLIPGHGGVLDRFDGLALLIVFVYILKLLNFKFYFIMY